MTINNEELKLLFRAFISKRVPGTRQQCPPFNELARFFQPGVPRKRKLKIIDHVTSCSPCAEEFEFLRGLHNYENQFVHDAGRIRSKQAGYSIAPGRDHKRSLIWRYAPVAAGVLLLIVSLTIIMKSDHPGETRSTTSSLVLLRPTSGQSVPITLVFEWKPVEDVDSYVLEIFDDTLLPFWRSTEITTTLFRPPEDLLKKLRPGTAYYWMVTARRSAKTMVESELRHFILVGEAP